MRCSHPEKPWPASLWIWGEKHPLMFHSPYSTLAIALVGASCLFENLNVLIITLLAQTTHGLLLSIACIASQEWTHGTGGAVCGLLFCCNPLNATCAAGNISLFKFDA